MAFPDRLFWLKYGMFSKFQHKGGGGGNSPALGTLLSVSNEPCQFQELIPANVLSLHRVCKILYTLPEFVTVCFETSPFQVALSMALGSAGK